MRRRERAKEWSFPADMFAYRGAHFVAPGFTNVLDAYGNLFAMAEQLQLAEPKAC